MTLVVSDISSHGIVMVGDSAVTLKYQNKIEIISDALKINYSKRLNIGVALWGYASIGKDRLDYWIDSFLKNYNESDVDIEAFGEQLAFELNSILSKSGLTWSDMVCGIHLTGFKGDLPCLYHIHCGHANEPSHELRLYHDFPEDKNWDLKYFKQILDNGFIHLRNGFHPLFGPLFDSILEYSKSLKINLNISFPLNNLQSRFKFYKLLVKFVAGVLPISGIVPSVNDKLSAIAFTKDGLKIDERLPLIRNTEKGDSNMKCYF